MRNFSSKFSTEVAAVLVAPVLFTSVLNATFAAAETPRGTQVQKEASQSTKKAQRRGLSQILSRVEIQQLELGYGAVSRELESAVRKLEPLVAASARGEKVDWSKILDDNSSTTGQALNKVVAFQLYYDGVGALLQLGKLTGEPRWYEIATGVGKTYVEGYLKPSQGKVPAYKHHATGLVALGELTSDQTLLQSVLKQEENAPYIALDAVSREEIKSPFLSRENALAIIAMANASQITGGKGFDETLFQYHLTCLKQHFKLWQEALKNPNVELPNWPKTVNGEYQGLDFIELEQVQKTYVRPFMVAISSVAAVRAYELDHKNEYVLKEAAETLRELRRTLWKESQGSFPYTDRKFGPQDKLTELSEGLTTEPTPDLNGIIGFAYILVGQRVSDADLEKHGEKMVHQGISSMFSGQKQLNQFLFPFGFTLLK